MKCDPFHHSRSDCREANRMWRQFAGLVHLLALIAVNLVSLGPLGASELRFSHRLHLEKVGAQCVDCHASAARSKQATDRNLPSEKECAACHDGARARPIDASGLENVPAAQRTFRFDHEFHLKLGNIQPLLAAAIDGGSYLGKPGTIRGHLNTDNPCHACHRGLEQTDLATQEHLPRMADCLVCHSEIDNPFSCETCHLEGVQLRPADHTRDFVDQHSTGKLNLDKSTCLPCHGDNFSCMGCH